jgi:hypothetical protein
MLVAPGEMKWNPGLKIYDKQKGVSTKVAKSGDVSRTVNWGVTNNVILRLRFRLVPE